MRIRYFHILLLIATLISFIKNEWSPYLPFCRAIEVVERYNYIGGLWVLKCVGLRFRATTPTRKLRKSKDKEKERDEDRDRNKDYDRGWMDLTLACTLAPSWYLRRTSWRESPPVAGLSRQFAAGLRSSLQFSNRPIFIFKMPQTDFN